MLLLYLAKLNAVVVVTQQTQKGQNYTQIRSLLVHSVRVVYDSRKSW